MNKPELLALMNDKYAELEQVLSPLSEAQWTTPGANGDWSIKDILAHLTAWQYVMLRRLHAAVRHEALDPQWQVAGEDIDSMNARFFAENRARPAAEVHDDFRATYREIAGLVATLSDADLFEAGRFAWLNDNTLWELVAGDTYEHYDEHMQSIRDWLAQSGTRP